MRKILAVLLCAFSTLGAAPAEKPEPVLPRWTYYVHSSPIGDLLQRPNIGFQYVYQRVTVGFKASWFRNASQVFDYGLDTSEDYGNVSARGFEIGPQFGYLFDFAWGGYLMPRIGIYRSIVHYSGGHSSCKNGEAGECTSAPPVTGVAVEAMVMLHAPVTEWFHFEFGGGLSEKFLVELNAGFAL